MPVFHIFYLVSAFFFFFFNGAKKKKKANNENTEITHNLKRSHNKQQLFSLYNRYVYLQIFFQKLWQSYKEHFASIYLCILCFNVPYIKIKPMNFALSLQLQRNFFLLIIPWIFLIKIVSEKLHLTIEIKVKATIAVLKCYLGWILELFFW